MVDQSVNTIPEPAAPASRKRSREEEQEDTIHDLRKQLKMEKQKSRRLVGRLEKGKSIITQLKEQNILSTDAYLTMQAQFSETTLELIRNEMDKVDLDKHGYRYSGAMKKFALALHFHSPNAYGFLRESFHLPSPRTMRQWRSNVDCNPG